MEAFKGQYIPAADYLFEHVPGFKMIITIPGETPNVLHDVQIFNDQDAFNGHVDMTNEELKNKVMSWFG